MIIFLTILTAEIIEEVIYRWHYAKYTFIVLFLTLFVVRFTDINDIDTTIPEYFESNSGLIQQAEQVYITPEIRSHYLLNLMFYNPLNCKFYNKEEPVKEKKVLLFIQNDSLEYKMNCIHNYCITTNFK